MEFIKEVGQTSENEPIKKVVSTLEEQFVSISNFQNPIDCEIVELEDDCFGLFGVGGPA